MSQKAILGDVPYFPGRLLISWIDTQAEQRLATSWVASLSTPLLPVKALIPAADQRVFYIQIQVE